MASATSFLVLPRSTLQSLLANPPPTTTGVSFPRKAIQSILTTPHYSTSFLTAGVSVVLLAAQAGLPRGGLAPPVRAVAGGDGCDNNADKFERELEEFRRSYLGDEIVLAGDEIVIAGDEYGDQIVEFANLAGNCKVLVIAAEKTLSGAMNGEVYQLLLRIGKDTVMLEQQCKGKKMVVMRDLVMKEAEGLVMIPPLLPIQKQHLMRLPSPLSIAAPSPSASKVEKDDYFRKLYNNLNAIHFRIGMNLAYNILDE